MPYITKLYITNQIKFITKTRKKSEFQLRNSTNLYLKLEKLHNSTNLYQNLEKLISPILISNQMSDSTKSKFIDQLSVHVREHDSSTPIKKKSQSEKVKHDKLSIVSKRKRSKSTKNKISMKNVSKISDIKSWSRVNGSRSDGVHGLNNSAATANFRCFVDPKPCHDIELLSYSSISNTSYSVAKVLSNTQNEVNKREFIPKKKMTDDKNIVIKKLRKRLCKKKKQMLILKARLHENGLSTDVHISNSTVEDDDLE